MMSRGTVLALSGGSFLLVFAIVLSIFGSGAVQNQGKALIGGPFELITAHGEKKTDRDFRGKLTLVMFGYTNCPDVCPTELQTVSQALDKLGKSADDVNAVFITVDPERDTPDVVSNYVKSFGPRFVGLSGSPSQIEGVAKAYRVYYRKADPQPGSSFYTMDHSALIYLMDQNGDYVTHFSFSADPDKIAEVLKKHLVAAKLA